MTLNDAIRECFMELVNRPDGCKTEEVVDLVLQRYPELVAKEMDSLVRKAIAARMVKIAEEPTTTVRIPRTRAVRVSYCSACMRQGIGQSAGTRCGAKLPNGEQCEGVWRRSLI